MNDTIRWFLGIDWGMDQHSFCLIDAAGAVHEERAVAHSTVALYDALEAMRQRANVAAEHMAIALETRHGVVVDTALDLGYRVFAINPKQLDRFRDRLGRRRRQGRSARCAGGGGCLPHRSPRLSRDSPRSP